MSSPPIIPGSPSPAAAPLSPRLSSTPALARPDAATTSTSSATATGPVTTISTSPSSSVEAQLAVPIPIPVPGVPGFVPALAPAPPVRAVGWEPDTQLPPPAESLPHVQTLPAPSPPAQSDHAGPADRPPGDKKGRGPAVLQKQSGVSLLTQALASARGIPKQLPSPPPAHSYSYASVKSKLPHHDSNPLQVPVRSTEQTDTPASPPELYNASSPPIDGGSLTPGRTPQSVVMAPSAALSSTMTLPLQSSPVEASTKHNTSSPNGIDQPFTDYRSLLGQAASRGKSLERLDREQTPLPSRQTPRAFSHSNSPDASTAMASYFDPRGHVASPRSGEWPGVDASGPQWPRRPEHRFSMGPEKIWSIGKGDLASSQDGQVEKSVTEAMVGAEPNARSRKASHTLGFFREGLPDLKIRRRESKLGPQTREKLSPNAVAEEEGTQGASGDAIPSSGLRALPHLAKCEDDALPASLTRANSFPAKPLEAASTAKSTQQDYVALGADQMPGSEDRSLYIHKPEFTAELDKTVSMAPAEDTSTVGGEPRRKSGDSTEVGESPEEGDESGEEKISSALFLPHQGLEASPVQEFPISSPGKPPTVRSASRAGDFHPWLVKADEPEPDDRSATVQKSDPTSARITTISPATVQETVTWPYDESAVDDEIELLGRRPSIQSRPVTQYYEDHVHEHQFTPRQPLEAIELIPYKHQVGGHTPLWRFSKRAVCKQLNNKENEFYETVEQYHRDLLAFLPRYIGVLNVTFQKQPRRKSTIKREDLALDKRPHPELSPRSPPDVGDPEGPRSTNGGSSQPSYEGICSPRTVSQSLARGQSSIPTVTFDNNRHILPRNLLQPTPPPFAASSRVRSNSLSEPPRTECEEGKLFVPQRPPLDERPNSWGATTVNKRLRNEVFNDAFLKQPIAVQKHQRPHERSIAYRKAQSRLRSSVSDTRPYAMDQPRAANGHATRPAAVLPTELLSGAGSDPVLPELASGPLPADAAAPRDVTGTSAPEPKRIAVDPISPKRKRRYSGSGLRRKPEAVTEPRGELKYFEEADVACEKGRHATDATASPLRVEPQDMMNQAAPVGAHCNGQELAEPGRPATEAAGTDAAAALPRKILRPVNPKEAQTEGDSRVEYFLLLEDLTAGMKRPCIMDLKMGTRQYGVEANAKKQRSQQGKCAKTTSRELGVRVCGLQVWDARKANYVFQDKYYGRSLKAGKEFQDALTRFLYDGADYHSVLRHIPTILQKLERLQDIVGRLRGYRFYAASLLMFYDGDASHDMSGYETLVDDSTTDAATDAEEGSSHWRRRRDRGEIDFKIADFANSLTAGDVAQGRPCPPQHPNEPDRGFLRGLSTLRKYLLKIQRDVREALGLDPQGWHGRLGQMRDVGDGEGNAEDDDEDEDDDEVSE